MDNLDRELLNEIQTGFPITRKPFQDLGVRLNCSEEEILARVRRLKRKGIIRRIGGNFDSKRLGFATTLCAAKVPEDRIKGFIEVVNRYPEVTHNYLRDNPYNIWFTLVARSSELVHRYVEEIKDQTGVRNILNLPAVKIFKILVDFDFD